MNPNQTFCFAFAILLRQIIDMQQQQIFAFFILYQRWVNEYIQILNVAFLRRKPWIRVAPYMWTIPSSAESWFDIHYLSSLLFLRPFVVFFSFSTKPSAGLKLVELSLSLTTLAELSDRLSKIPLGLAWSKIGPANLGSKWRKFWLRNDPGA